MKRILLILLLISPAMAVAQDESDDPYVECAEVLSSSPANRLIAMSEDGTYGKLEKLLRPRLLGKTCSVDQFIVYMLDAGCWMRDGNSKVTGFQIMKRHENPITIHMTAQSPFAFQSGAFGVCLTVAAAMPYYFY